MVCRSSTLPRRTMRLIRRSPGEYIDGRYVEGGEVATTIKGSAQPASGRDLEALPEGRRSTETVKIYTQTKLRTAAADVPADRLKIDGSTYEVVMAAQNASGVRSHCKALAQAIQT